MSFPTLFRRLSSHQTLAEVENLRNLRLGERAPNALGADLDEWTLHQVPLLQAASLENERPERLQKPYLQRGIGGPLGPPELNPVGRTG